MKTENSTQSAIAPTQTVKENWSKPEINIIGVGENTLGIVSTGNDGVSGS